VGAVIGDILPFAVGIAISPFPIIVVVLTLLGPRPRAGGAGFLIGWIAGLLVAFGVIVALVAYLPAGSSGKGVWAGLVEIALGGLLMLLAVLQWRKRPRGDDDPELPGWMSKVSSYGFPQALRLGFLLAAVNPKHVVFLAGASVEVGAADLETDAVVLVIAVFTLIAASSVIVPLLAYVTASARLTPLLEGLQGWLARENHTIMAVLFLVLGANAIGNGIGSIWP
jgi:threonine/homoserine/homoserine lactone efflux protein